MPAVDTSVPTSKGEFSCGGLALLLGTSSVGKSGSRCRPSASICRADVSTFDECRVRWVIGTAIGIIRVSLVVGVVVGQKGIDGNGISALP